MHGLEADLLQIRMSSFGFKLGKNGHHIMPLLPIMHLKHFRIIRHQKNNESDIWGDSKGNGGDHWGDSKKMKAMFGKQNLK